MAWKSAFLIARVVNGWNSWLRNVADLALLSVSKSRVSVFLKICNSFDRSYGFDAEKSG